MMKPLLIALGLLGFVSSAEAQTFTPVPFIFVFGQQANASQVMADFQSVVNNGNSVANYINSQIAAITPPPSQTLLFFNLSACPTGWTVGNIGTNFVRGLDLGRGADTTGTAITGAEATVMQDHIHGTSNGALSFGTVAVSVGGAVNLPAVTGTPTVTNTNTGGAVGGTPSSEARPKNVSLLLCRKN